MEKQWLPLALVGEYFLALIAIWMSWRSTLGDFHLENIPWQMKLPLALGLAFCLVMLTRARLQAPGRARSAGSWLVLTLMVIALMAAVSAQYTPVEEESTEAEAVPLTGTMQRDPLPPCPPPTAIV